MRDTVHCLIDERAGEADEEAITRSIHDMIAEVQKAMPGYKLVNSPVFDGQRFRLFGSGRPRRLSAEIRGQRTS